MATRGHLGAAARLSKIARWRISVVTWIELAQGCRDKAELEATALEQAQVLLSGNSKHFKSIEGMEDFDSLRAA